MDHLVLKDFKALLDQKEIKETREFKVLKVMMEIRVLWVLQDHKVNKGYLVCKVHQDLKDLLVNQQLDCKVREDYKEKEGQLGSKVLKV